MAQLQRLEDPRDPLVGGFAITFPSGTCKSCHWRQEAPIVETRPAAKEFAAKVLDAMLKEKRTDDCERTNWPSVVAAVERIIKDWNELRRAALYATQPLLQGSAATH